MSKIIIGTAGQRKIGFDLDVLLPSRLLITADSGAGKSWVMRVLQEQAFGKVQIITIDPEGEFATLREKFPFVLVGKGGETPADIRSAGLVAQRLLQLRASAICDIYDLKPQQRHHWTKLFLDGLIEAPKELRNPLLLIVDEAHIFGPEKGESEALGSMVDVATRGRKRGICLVCATQRLAMLNKDITSNLQNRLVGAQFEDVNRKRAGEMLGVLPGAPMREFFHQIQLLKPGGFFAFGRAIAEERTLIEVGPIQTSHPKAFGAKHTAPPPPTPDEIKAMLPELADLPKEAEDKARTEADFKREIRELKTKLTLAEKAQGRPLPAPGSVSKSNPTQARLLREMQSLLVDVMKIIAKINAIGFDGAEVKQEDLQAALERAVGEIARIAAQKVAMKRRELESLKSEVNRLIAKLNAKLGDDKLEISLDVVKNEPVTVRPVSPSPQRREPRPAVVPVNGFSPAQIKILSRLVELMECTGSEMVRKEQLAAWSEYSPNSGGFNNNLGSLRSAGMIEYPSGGYVTITDEGRKLAQPESVPASSEEMLERAKRVLNGSEGKLLEHLHRERRTLPKDELAQVTGFSPNSGGFNNNLGHMRTLGFVEYPSPGAVRASSWLYLNEAA